MALPDEAVVRRTLSVNNRDARIRLCIEKSWSDLKDKYTERPQWRRKSTTRAIMWENCVETVVAEFESDSGIKPVPHHDTVSFVADDLVFFRFKKATSGLFTSNYPTTLAELFHVHRRDLF
jgi:hypothetical protein